MLKSIVARCMWGGRRLMLDRSCLKGRLRASLFISAIRASAGKAAIWSKGCAVRMPICPWSAHGLFLGRLFSRI